MFSGMNRYLLAAVTAVALSSAAAVLPGDIAIADPGQDQKFFDLLGQKDIPPVDNANSLIETAHKACSKLDGGMSVGELVELIRNNGYHENPLTRFNPADQITRTINLFIIASVEAYCPYDRGKIASITAYRATPPGGPTYRVTAYGHNAVASRGVMLASLVTPVPDGEIAPTKPVPVPAQPPPSPPEELAPAPQQPPPPPKRVQKAPPPQQQVAPPPEEPPPPQEPPPQAEPPEAPAPAPQAPAPAPAPSGGSGGAPAPESPAPAPPSPPGHIRLAP